MLAKRSNNIDPCLCSKIFELLFSSKYSLLWKSLIRPSPSNSEIYRVLIKGTFACKIFENYRSMFAPPNPWASLLTQTLTFMKITDPMKSAMQQRRAEEETSPKTPMPKCIWMSLTTQSHKMPLGLTMQCDKMNTLLLVCFNVNLVAIKLA